MRSLGRALMLFGLAFAFPAAAQDSGQGFPSRPIALICPWPAGGSTDTHLRRFAEIASKYLGQPILIENRPGGGGMIGPGNMAQTARPDGYTLSQLPVSAFRIPHMQKVAWDPVRDFTYIIGLTGYTFGVVVRDDAPWKTFGEFLADAKANPGKINYGTPGAGSSLHITMEQIAKQRGIKWTHVPFKGSAETTNALLGGHIHAVADSTGWAPLVNAGKFRLLVTWGVSRTKNWPDAPTLRDLGIDMVSNSPFGIAGPKGMDAKVVKVLHDAFKKGIAEPGYIDTMIKLDQEPFYLDSADYRAFALKQLVEQKRVIEELGLRQE